ncbi:hypothetical protein CJ026_000225 [Ralstonia pickettii]|jgi:hypothetical protein|uniref:type 4 pilus major pilin n=1 Tax=Ralstonia pickettii TaxID=329 RepID=UPI000BD0B428|nr:type 4 pilus major pilin [Ralstonia pickettii]MBT2180854.1 hypothetical protein [Ralstonia pickettii]POH90112.1 hypothetical protein CJ026_000225 [Ralstonia pickettii]
MQNANNTQRRFINLVTARRRQKGASTGEYVFWSILAGFVIVGILFTYLKGYNGGQAQQLVKDMTSLMTDGSQNFNGQWANFTTTNASTGGLFKGYASLTDNGGGVVIVQPGSGRLTVAPGTLSTANDSGQYTVTGLTQDTCKTFSAGIKNAAGSLVVNGTTVKAYGGSYSPQLLQCTSNNNTVVATAG